MPLVTLPSCVSFGALTGTRRIARWNMRSQARQCDIVKIAPSYRPRSTNFEPSLGSPQSSTDMAEFTESTVKQAAIAWLQAIGYAVATGAVQGGFVGQAMANFNPHLSQTNIDAVVA